MMPLVHVPVLWYWYTYFILYAYFNLYFVENVVEVKLERVEYEDTLGLELSTGKGL